MRAKLFWEKVGKMKDRKLKNSRRIKDRIDRLVVGNGGVGERERFGRSILRICIMWRQKQFTVNIYSFEGSNYFGGGPLNGVKWKRE